MRNLMLCVSAVAFTIAPTIAKLAIGFVLIAALASTASGVRVVAQTESLPAPGFHHLHLNSTNPDAAIAFYARAFPSTSKSTWGGFPALTSPTNVLVLFSKVDQPPGTQPQTAVWHFGWHVTSERQTHARFVKDGVTLLPLYTTDEGGTVPISSDTWPGTGGVLGLTKAQIADAKAKGVKPNGGAGFGYIRGPDDALVEYQGDMPAERFNHVHMYQEQPFCAQLWYREHLNAVIPQGRGPGPPPRVFQRGGVGGGEPRTEAKYLPERLNAVPPCQVTRGPDRTWPSLEVDGTYRTPTAGVTFGTVAVNWYMRQGERPLVPTRGRLVDHFAVSVPNLDAWVTKLRRERVRFLLEPYKLGDTRAVLIEGPSLEAVEIVEVK